MLELFLDLIIPPRASERVVRRLTLQELRALGEPLPYRDPRVTALVWEVKYYKSRRAAALCGALLSEQLLAAAAEEIGVPLLIPVPMHPARRRERGHNQTEVLAKAALRRLGGGIEYAPYALSRTRTAPEQQKLTRKERLQNIKHSMEATAAVAGRACIVLDDVETTGATLSEARRALAAMGARSVHGIVLAR